MHMTDRGLIALARHEGIVPAPYLDVKRVWTFGVGHTAGAGAPDPAILRSHAAMQCASLLREAMWSMVSELHLTAPGADYVGYTAENLDRLDRALDHYRTKYGKHAK